MVFLLQSWFSYINNKPACCFYLLNWESYFKHFVFKFPKKSPWEANHVNNPYHKFHKLQQIKTISTFLTEDQVAARPLMRLHFPASITTGASHYSRHSHRLCDAAQSEWAECVDVSGWSDRDGSMGQIASKPFKTNMEFTIKITAYKIHMIHKTLRNVFGCMCKCTSQSHTCMVSPYILKKVMWHKHINIG